MKGFKTKYGDTFLFTILLILTACLLLIGCGEDAEDGGNGGNGVTPNQSPVADAGAYRMVFVDDTVTLDGSGSSDADGDPLTYQWLFVSRPEGSDATLSDTAAVNPTFVVDVAGAYVVQLIVNDGTVDSDPDAVTITGSAEAEKFNSSASLGDLLTYTIDTTNMAYFYEIVDSEYGLTGTTGSGTLVQNQDGTYSPFDDPDISLILLPNTVIVGGADVIVGGVDTFMLFAGVPALDTGYYKPAEIAGIYNYIVFECDDPLEEGVCTSGYRSYYGTFEIEEDNTWKACDEGDIGDVESNPCSGPPMTGNWIDEGDGIISITYGGTEIAKAMFLPSGAGGKVMVIDFKDRQDAGPGILIGVKQQDISGEDLSGKYHYNSDDGGHGELEVYDDDIYSETNTESATGSLHRNSPWDGWLTSDNNTVADATDDSLNLILPGDGVFLQTSPRDNTWINVGGKIP